MDGKPADAATVHRKRAVFFNSLEYAVELGHLAANPIPSIKWCAPKVTESVIPRVVINHVQARALFEAVRTLPRGGRPVAFFAVMYYSALRPSEAVDLRKDALSLPKKGRGEL